MIETTELTRRYGSRRGIESVSLIVPEGCIFGFLGPNGAGKTTLIRTLLGLLRPSSGAAQVFGLDCWRDSAAVKAEVGYVPGDLRLYSWMTGEQALAIFGQTRGKELRHAGKQIADEFQLDLTIAVRQMSRGTRQKLGLVLALAHAPRLLILDEPTSALDPLMQNVLLNRLRRMASGGHTIFFSSHTLSEVELLCDRVAIIRAGRIVADETLDVLRGRGAHEVQIRWRDEAAANSLAPPEFVHLEQREGQTWKALVRGPLDPFLRWLIGQPFDDLSISRPDLETLFQEYYQPGGPQP